MGAIVAVITTAFRDQMRRLLGLKFAPSDMLTHWEALQDVPLDVLSEAVGRAQKTRAEFPSPSELRQDCDAVAHLVRHVEDEDRGEDLPAPVGLGTLPDGTPIVARRLWRFYHDDCTDSGMESCWCGERGPYTPPWLTSMACERNKAHLPHEWVRKCTCFDSNPALIARRERMQKYADQKADRK